MKNAFIVFAFLVLPAASIAHAQENPPEIRICSQNLFRYGDSSSRQAKDPKWKEKQGIFLVSRMLRAKCDVIALQEVIGKSKKESLAILATLKAELEKRSGRSFQIHVGDSYDSFIRNGFFVADDIGKTQSYLSYHKDILPQLQPRARPQRFLRAPIAVLLQVPGKSERPARQVYVLNMHLKSKAHAYKDPSGTNFELTRMEMAEGLREIIAREMRRYKTNTTFVLLGDRNSEIGSASAEIISGERLLSDFQQGGVCRLSEQIEMLCDSPPRDGVLIPLFALRRAMFPGEYLGGSYLYGRKQELLDEIYLAPTDIEFAKRANGRFALGMEGEFFKGSDHKLVWLELNW